VRRPTANSVMAQPNNSGAAWRRIIAKISLQSVSVPSEGLAAVRTIFGFSQ